MSAVVPFATPPEGRNPTRPSVASATEAEASRAAVSPARPASATASDQRRAAPGVVSAPGAGWLSMAAAGAAGATGGGGAGGGGGGVGGLGGGSGGASKPT